MAFYGDCYTIRMGYLSAGYTSYPEFLSSRHFTRQRKIAWFFSFRCCSICWKRYQLSPHHLSYLVVGKWYEFLFLRFLCNDHHRAVQFFFGHKLTSTFPLIAWYYCYKFLWSITVGVFRIGLWLHHSYSLDKSVFPAVKYARRRRQLLRSKYY